jgi:phosphoribosylformylglycinamidine cyclo-ligase
MTCTSGATSLETNVPSTKEAPLAENSYEAAGVSIERGEQSVDRLRPAAEETHGPEVLGAPGGFAGLYALVGYSDPVLASTIDGVGTKILVARELGRYDSLGVDIVNHCANDVLATGARPLFFLDYVASGRLDPEAVAGIVKGAAEACGLLGVALIGGETAEMPGIYGRGDFEIVGVCVGACERSEVVGGEQVQPGDTIIGLASSGLHTNGYTLARKVIEDAGLTYDAVPEGLDRPVGEVYLEPHRAYVREVDALRGAVEVRGMAHVTGGGLVGNLPRALGGLGARLDAGSWSEPAVFGVIRSLGGIPESEMRGVFNLGVGFCAVVPPEEAAVGLEALRGAGQPAWRIGEVTEAGGVEFV